MKKGHFWSYIIVILGFMVAFVGNYPQFQLSPLSYIIIPQLNLSASQFSSIFSASMIPGILLSLISGLLCDKFGVKKCISFAGVVACMGIVLRLWSTTYETLLICMLLSGVGATFLNSNIGKLLSKWFPPEKMGVMAGLVLAGTPTAQIIGMSTTAYIPSVRSAYIIAALLSIIVAVLWIVFAKEESVSSAALKKESVQKEEPAQTLGENLRIVLTHPAIWCIGISLMFMLGSIIALSSFLPLALQNANGLSVQSASGVAAFVMIGSLVGTILGPILCEKSGNMKLFICICGIIAGLGTAFSWRLPSGFLMLSGMFITGFASNAIIPIMMSLPIRLKGIGFERGGTAGGVVATIQLLGAVIIPTYIIVPIAGNNYSIFLILAGVSAVICGFIALGLPNSKSRS